MIDPARLSFHVACGAEHDPAERRRRNQAGWGGVVPLFAAACEATQMGSAARQPIPTPST